jgi:hypothetical protein
MASPANAASHCRHPGRMPPRRAGPRPHRAGALPANSASACPRPSRNEHKGKELPELTRNLWGSDSIILARIPRHAQSLLKNPVRLPFMLQREPDWRLPALWRHEYLNVLATFTREGGATIAEATTLWRRCVELFGPREQSVDMSLPAPVH